MADDAPKGRKGKQEAGVLAGLPATRPSRMSRRGRTAGPSVEATRAAASQAADTREATGSRATGKRTTAADKTRKTKAAPQRAGAAKTQATKRPAAKPRAKRTAPTAVAVEPAAAPARKPRAVRVGSPALKEPTEKAESRREDVPVARPAQSGTELVTTVVQAAGELASIGVTLGGQILKRAAGKLPRP